MLREKRKDRWCSDHHILLAKLYEVGWLLQKTLGSIIESKVVETKTGHIQIKLIPFSSF